MREGSLSTNGNAKLAKLRNQREQLDARIVQIEAAEKTKERKVDTRYKILFGSSLLADLSQHPELGQIFEESLRRAVTSDRDKELLRAKGWRL